MAKGTPQVKKREEVIVRGHTTEVYTGPIPHPSTLAAFNDIVPDGADRIIKMAEKDQDIKAQIRLKSIDVRDTASKREHLEILAGQTFAFLLCAGALVGGVYLIATGHEVAGGILSGASLASVLKTLITRK